MEDESIYEDKGDPIEEEVIETFSNEVTDEEFINESYLFEGNRDSPPDVGSTDNVGVQMDSLEENRIPETEEEQEFTEETSAEYGVVRLHGKYIIDENETENKIEEAFPVEEHIEKPDSLLVEKLEEIMNESMIEAKLGISGKNQVLKF